MRTKMSWLVCFICISIAVVHADDRRERIKGNGKIETRTIEVKEYDQVILGEGIEYEGNSGLNFKRDKKERYPVFVYRQANGAATLEITMDENLFRWLVIKQDKGKLRIRAEKNTQLKPTHMKIRSSSKELTHIVVSGCMDFINEQALLADELRLSVDGVGDIRLTDLAAGELTCRITGVGNIHLRGEAEKGSYEVSGVGKIFGYDCDVKDLNCDVSGVGRMEVRASRKLKAGTSGVGGIRYKGDAEVDSWSSGIGKVKKAN